MGPGGGVRGMPATDAITLNHISEITVQTVARNPKHATTTLITPIAVITPGRELAAGGVYASAATGTGGALGMGGGSGSAGSGGG
jgi:hypothetical protein